MMEGMVTCSEWHCPLVSDISDMLIVDVLLFVQSAFLSGDQVYNKCGNVYELNVLFSVCKCDILCVFWCV